MNAKNVVKLVKKIIHKNEENTKIRKIILNNLKKLTHLLYIPVQITSPLYQWCFIFRVFVFSPK